MINGWVILDKPLGLSSMQATSRVKRLLSLKKAGHAGTLDPLATGVLPIALGEATKTIPYSVEATKTYEFTVKWGVQTTTDDAEGEVLHTSEARPHKVDIQRLLSEFIGDITQTPPAYSAIKINGQRAYKLARGGEVVQMPSRTVHLQSLELINVVNEEEASFQCICSKGTYIRSLARDMALALGTYGHVSSLRRTAVGGFDEKNAISLDFLEEMSHKDDVKEYILPIDAVLDDIPDLVLEEDEARRFSHGQCLLMEGLVEGHPFVCKGPRQDLLGIGRFVEGRLKPVRMFNILERRI